MQISMPFCTHFALRDKDALDELKLQIIARRTDPKPSTATKLVTIIVGAPDLPDLPQLVTNITTSLKDLYGIAPSTIAAQYQPSNLHLLTIAVGELISAPGV